MAIVPPPSDIPQDDLPPCPECGTDVDTAPHHVWCIAPLDQLEGDA